MYVGKENSFRLLGGKCKSCGERGKIAVNGAKRASVQTKPNRPDHNDSLFNHPIHKDDPRDRPTSEPTNLATDRWTVITLYRSATTHLKTTKERKKKTKAGDGPYGVLVSTDCLVNERTRNHRRIA